MQVNPQEVSGEKATTAAADLRLVSVEQLKKIHRELDACQKVIWLAGCRPRVPNGFDPAYVTGAQEQLQVIEALLAAEPPIPSAPVMVEQSCAALDVLAERRRQVEAEGMSTAADDRYQAAELPRAAASYILNGANDEAPAIWPWAKSWWKPRDARANYVRAGALILAEIERLDRAALAQGGAQ